MWLALAACGGGGRASVPKEPVSAGALAAAAPFAFDWAPPCRVPAVESILKDGNTLVLRFVFDVRALDGGEIAIGQVEHLIVSVNGEAVSVADQREHLADLTALLAAIPTFVVGGDGAFVRMDRLEEIVEKSLQHQPPAERARLRTVMLSPETRALMSEMYGTYWFAWVGAWIDWPVPLGETSTIDLGDPDVAAVAEHLGVFDGLPHLRYSERWTGEAIHAQFEPLIQAAIRSADRAEVTAESTETMLAEVLKDASRQTTFEVQVEPAGLRPHVAVFSSVGEFVYRGEHVRNEERRRTEFDWAHAQGCGGRP